MQREDADLAFERYRNGGKPADLARVFEQCAPQLLLLAHHVAGGMGSAEDLVQSTFLRAIEAADRFEPGRPVLPWLVGILVREAKKHKRDAARTPDPQRVDERRETIPLEAAEAKEFQEAIVEAIESLPQVYREVLTLRLIHGLTPTEIAHLRAVSPETVKTQLRRGSERLRGRLPAGFAAVVVGLALGTTSLASVRDVVLAAAAEAAPIGVDAVDATPESVDGPTGAGDQSVANVIDAPVQVARLSRGGRWLVAAGAGVIGAAAWIAVTADDGERRPLTSDATVASDRSEPRVPMRRPVAADTTSEVPESAPLDGALVSFRGRIVDARGFPVPDMTVELFRLHADALVVDAAPLPSSTVAPPLVAGAVATDVDGRFAVDGVTPWGTFTIRVDPGGDHDAWILIDRTPAPHDEVDLGDIRLGRRRVLVGRIVDAAGRGIEGVRLRRAGPTWVPPENGDLGLLGTALGHVARAEFEPEGGIAVRLERAWHVVTVPPWARELYARIVGRIVVTGPDGGFAWVTTRGGVVELDVYKPGFAPRLLRRQAPMRRADLGDVPLDRAHAFECAVSDVFGDPVADVEVMFGSRSGAAESAILRPGGVTDPLGVVHVPWTDERPVFAAVRRGPGHPWRVTDLMPTDRRLHVRLAPEHDVFLRVGDRAGSAIPEPSVRLVSGETTSEADIGMLTLHQLGCVEPLDVAARIERSEEGVVHVSRVPEGEYLVIVAAPGYGAVVTPLSVSGRVDRLIELPRLESTAIAVDDIGFRAQSNLPVLVRTPRTAGSVLEFPALVGRTDAEGTLSFARHRWSRLAVSTAQAELGWYHAQAAPGTEAMTVTVPKRGVIDGHLTEHGEVPRADAWIVCATPAYDEDQPQPAISPPPVFCPPDLDGVFRFAALEPGRWCLRAVHRPSRLDAPGHLLSLLFADPDAEPVAFVDVAPGGYAGVRLEALGAVAVADEIEPEVRTLHGTVRIGGRPAAGYTVLTARGGGWQASVVDDDGRFDCGFEPTGPVRLVITEVGATFDPENYLWRGDWAFAAAAPTVVDIDLDLQPMTCLVRTAGGSAARDIQVVLEGALDGAIPAASRFVVRADRGGWFEIPHVPAGRYTMRVTDPVHGWLERRDLLVGRDQVTLGMSVQLEPLLHVAGRVDSDRLGLDFEPADGSKLVLERRADDGVPVRRVVVLGRRSTFRADGLLPGTYDMTIHAAILVVRGGRTVRVLPEQSNIRVAVDSVTLVDRGVDGLVLTR